MPTILSCATVSRLLAVGLLAVASPRLAPAQPSARPPVPPVFVPNSCTIECCPLGEWGVKASLAVHATPHPGAPGHFRVAPGTVLTADSSVVRVDTLGVVVMRTAHIAAEGAPPFSPGDSVFVLHYGGEGTAEVWYRGATYQISVFWHADDPAQRAELPGRLVREPIAEWWARVRDVRGRMGWVIPDPRVINAAFDCSGA